MRERREQGPRPGGVGVATSEAALHEFIVNHYDGICDMSELRVYYGDSDFLNLGYWDEDTKNQRDACEALMERLLAYIPEKRGTILDVACGMGQTTAYLLEYFAAEDVTGINISEKQLEIARANAPDCSFQAMNAVEMGFPDGSFDNMICVEAVFHFNTRQKFLEEARRVLKPGGWLVFSDVLMTLEEERRRESRCEENFVVNLGEYEEVFARAGFEELELVDVTEACWRRHYWYAVRYFHQKFLDREISGQQLAGFLEGTYRRASCLEYYLIGAVQKT